MANDYWAYLRDNNELKHYRTPGALNKNPIKGTRLPDGTIVYDDKVAAAQARGQARQQQASRAAKERLVDRGASGGNENRYSGGSGNNDGSYGRTKDLVAEAQARGQARQRQASRAAKERLIERGNNGGGVKRDYPEADYFVEKVIHAPDRNEAKANLKKQQLAWRESQNQTVGSKIKNAYNSAKEKTLGAIDSIRRKLAKKR